jgi:predicted metal-dependent hydrolase
LLLYDDSMTARRRGEHNSRVREQAHRQLMLEGRAVPVLVRRSRRARRITLRIDQRRDAVTLVLPWRGSEAEGMRFAASKTRWLLARLDELPPKVAFRDGARLPFQGTEHTIRHRPDARGGVWREGSEIHVAGDHRHMARRLTDWLKKQARAEIGAKARDAASTLGRRVKRITLRDAATRWGSCSADGALAFSWRLILAPSAVLDYVVAHEVAHLKEMNHSRKFWTLVGLLHPAPGRARAWLRANGTALQRYG